MEMIEFENEQAGIVAAICHQNYTGIKDNNLSRRIKEYKEKVRNYAAIYRRGNNLTHNGKIIKTPSDFERVCKIERWDWLLDDAKQASSDA